MPLYFTDRKKHWPPPKPVQYLLAGIVLVLAIGVLTGWLLLRFVYNEEVKDPGKTTPTTSTSQLQSELPDTAYCLVVINDAGYERFALIELAPSDGKVTVRPIPSSLKIAQSETLAQMQQRTKEAQVTEAIASYYRIPLKHYISLSIKELESLITGWSGSVQLAPAEEIVYQDENGVTVHIPAEFVTLTPKQVAASLRYAEWKNQQNSDHFTADLTVAILRYVLSPNRDLNRCFIDIADHTNLLIQQFNSYYPGLTYLASLDNNDVVQSGDMLDK